MNNTTDGEKIKHKAFTVKAGMQLWAEQNIGKVGFTIFQTFDFPGAQPVQVMEAKSAMDVEILIGMLTSMFARNIVEGSEVDVSALKKQ